MGDQELFDRAVNFQIQTFVEDEKCYILINKNHLMKNLLEIILIILDIICYLYKGINAFMNNRHLIVARVQSFDQIHGRKVEIVFETTLITGAFAIFGLGCVLCAFYQLLHYPTWKLILLMLGFAIGTGMIYLGSQKLKR